MANKETSNNVVELRQSEGKKKAPPDPKGLTNLVSSIPEDKQKTIAGNIVTDYDYDLQGLSGHRNNINKWYKQWACIVEPKTEPFLKSSNVCIPLLATASNQFHARAYQAIFAPPGMVRTIPVGKNDITRARNVEKYMNWQVLYEMEEYEDIFDKTLSQLPINGTCFKKLYQDKEKNRVVSEYIGATELVLPYGTRDFQSARRKTQELWLHYDQLEARNKAGLYKNFKKVSKEAGKKQADGDSAIKQTADDNTGEKPLNQSDEPKLILECHKDLDLGDGRKPYIVTVDYDSSTLLRVVSRVFETGSEKFILDYFIDYHFIRNPEGFYSLGFGHYLEQFSAIADTVLNQIIDSGRLSNQPWGFYGRRAGLKKKKIKLQPGEMIEVEDVKQVFFPQMQRVDSVLFQVLGLIQQYVEQFTSVSDPILGRSQKGVERPTASGTVAMIEQGLVTFTVMTKRIFRSLKKELRLLMTLNQIYLPDTKEYRVMEDIDNIAFSDFKKEDFSGVHDVLPTGDPSFASRSTKRREAMERYQILMSNPLIIGSPPDPNTGQREFPPNRRAIYEALNDVLVTYETVNKQKLLPELPEESKPPDQENAMFNQGDYVSPKPGENHQEHLQIHAGFVLTEFYAAMPDDYKGLHNRHVQETRVMQSYDQQQQAALEGGQGGIGLGEGGGLSPRVEVISGGSV
jgi:hypothetical protein